MDFRVTLKLDRIILLLCLTSSSANVLWPKSTLMDLDILTPPQVIEPERQRSQYVSYQSVVHLRCHAWGTPPLTYQWIRNGEWIPSNSSRVKQFPDNGSLIITSFSGVDDEGYYQCRASNLYGVSPSDIIELRMRVTPPFSNPEAQAGGRVYRVEEGGGVALPCYSKPALIPPGPFSWYYKTATGQDQIQIRSISRFDMDVNGTLYITMAETSDERDSYACAALNDLLDVVLLAGMPYTKVQVFPSHAAAGLKPVVLGHSGHVTGDKGREITLECFFSGKPAPIISWWDGSSNKEIVNSTDGRISISFLGRRLTIKQLTEDDEGNYMCRASNSMGQISAMNYINVTSRPLFEKESPQNIVAPTGNDATFSCLAKGALGELAVSPPEWTINGEKMGSNDRISFSMDDTRLTVKNVTKDDRMCVQCNVTNSRGYAFGSGYLAVIDPLVITTHPNVSVLVEPEMVWLNLTVEATSDPCCPVIFAWYLNDKVLSKTIVHRHPYNYELGNNNVTLFIRLDGPREEVERLMGRYRCDVFHWMYSQNGSVTVDVSMESLTIPAQQQAAEVNYWWIGVLGGVLLLVLAIALIIFMIRNNYPRQEYLLDRMEKKHKLNPEQDILDQSFQEI